LNWKTGSGSRREWIHTQRHKANNCRAGRERRRGEVEQANRPKHQTRLGHNWKEITVWVTIPGDPAWDQPYYDEATGITYPTLLDYYSAQLNATMDAATDLVCKV
jgi:hypothetical protein